MFAHSTGGAMMRALAPHYTHEQQLRTRLPSPLCADPLGAITIATTFGFAPRGNDFARQTVRKRAAPFCWAMLRNGRAPTFDRHSDKDDTFAAMALCTDRRLWRLVVGELLIARHPLTLETLLHIAARSNNCDAVRVCRSFNLNPLLRNEHGQLAIDLTTDAIVRAELVSYAQWRPTKAVSQWFGPYFEDHAIAWLLVCNRWQQTGVRQLYRDVRLRVVRWLAAVEETHVTY